MRERVEQTAQNLVTARAANMAGSPGRTHTEVHRRMVLYGDRRVEQPNEQRGRTRQQPMTVPSNPAQ
jgi:hypothetical protein